MGRVKEGILDGKNSIEKLEKGTEMSAKGGTV